MFGLFVNKHQLVVAGIFWHVKLSKIVKVSLKFERKTGEIFWLHGKKANVIGSGKRCAKLLERETLLFGNY